jgi:hypothetical protein
MLKSVLWLGNEEQIRSFSSAINKGNTDSLKYDLHHLVGRGFESLALDVAENSGLTRSDRITTLCGHRQIPTMRFIGQFIDGNPEAETDVRLAMLVFGFLRDYDALQSGIKPTADRRGMEARAKDVVAALMPNLKGAEIGSPLHGEVIVAACCCMELLSGTAAGDAIRTELEQLRDSVYVAVPSCAIRGWAAAFEAGCSLLDSDSYEVTWSFALTSSLSVVLDQPPRPTRLVQNQRIDDRRRSLQSFLEGIARRQYRGAGGSLESLLQHESPQRLPESLYFCFQASRMMHDAELLKIANIHLFSAVAKSTEYSSSDKAILMISSIKAAMTLGDAEQLKKVTNELTQILALAGADREWHKSLVDYRTNVPFEVAVALANKPDAGSASELLAQAVGRLNEELTRPSMEQKQRVQLLRALGALWIMAGAQTTDLTKIRRMFSVETEDNTFLQGVGLLSAEDPVVYPSMYAWQRCADANLLERADGVANLVLGAALHNSPQRVWYLHDDSEWNARLVLLVDAMRQSR